VILVTAAVLLILLFLLRRRRRQLQEQRLEVPELPTKANRHELDSKGLETITEKPPEQGDSNTTSELPGQLPTQEQIAANTGIRNSGALVEIDTGPRTLSKDGKKEVVQDVMTGREATAPEFAGPTISTAPIVTPQMSTLEALQAKLDKIRTEKERLTKMQELEDMEAELQREIAQEQNRQRIVATEAAIHQSELP
jgi:hypothetical protein